MWRGKESQQKSKGGEEIIRRIERGSKSEAQENKDSKILVPPLTCNNIPTAFSANPRAGSSFIVIFDLYKGVSIVRGGEEG